MGKILFQKGNKAAENKRGKKHKFTLLKEKLGVNNIEELKADVLKVWQELITDEKKKDFAAKEISKYIFAQKREHSGEQNQNITVNFKY